MLHAPIRPSAAKLDISRLLESSPSPQPRSVVKDSPKNANVARSASDPPPARTLQHESHRGSVSSTHSGSDSYAALSASSLPPQLSGQVGTSPLLAQHQQRSSQQQPSYQSQQQRPPLHRPRIPSMSSLPLPAPSLPHLDAPLRSSRPLPGPSLPEPAGFSFPQAPKRSAQGEHAAAPPAKRQSKWTAEEDALVIELRGAGMKWEDISKRIPGRTPLSCRLHYQNYIERRSQWDEDRKNRLARLYERLKPEMWKPLAAELNVPWRAAEAMHWQLGQVEMARRAGVTPFSISSGSSTSAVLSRVDPSLADTSPTAVYTPASPYVGSSYTSPAYSQPLRQGYFDDRDQTYRAPPPGRPRSVSASSGDDRRASGVGRHASSGWSMPGSATISGRLSSDTWPLPRLPEVDDTQTTGGAEPGHRVYHD